MEKTRTIEKKEEKQPKTPKQMTLFVLKIVGNVVFYTVIILLFLYSLMNINAKGKNGIPNLFGKGFLSVQSTSMSIEQDTYGSTNKLPEQYENYKIKSFNKGDLLQVTMLSNKAKQKLKVGDVITYWDDDINDYNTHRIVYMSYDEEGKIKSFCTQGDNSVLVKGVVFDPTSEDSATMNALLPDIDTFNQENLDIVKAITYRVDKGSGTFVDFIREYWMFIFVIPIAIILVIEIVLVVKNVLDLRREKNKNEDKLTHEQQMAELQSEKERMRAELLAELRSQGVITEEAAPAAAAVEEASEAPVEETKDEIATDTKEDAPVEVEAEEIKEEQPEEVIEEPVVEEVPQEETKSEENIEAVEENKGEEEPVVEEKKEEAEASNLNISLEENEEEKPVKKTTAKKTSSKKKKDE